MEEFGITLIPRELWAERVARLHRAGKPVAGLQPFGRTLRRRKDLDDILAVRSFLAGEATKLRRQIDGALWFHSPRITLHVHPAYFRALCRGETPRSSAPVATPDESVMFYGFPLVGDPRVPRGRVHTTTENTWQ